jgi:PAS domain S-box-containing protein
MRLFEFLNIQNFGGNSQLFFDIMLLFLNITLVIYILSNIRVPTTVEEMYKKLEDTNLLVDDLILHSPDPMCMCNNDGFILKANKEFFNTFGIDNNYTNVNIFLFDFNFERDVTQELQKAKLGNTLHIDNVKYYKKDGSIIYLSIKIYPTLSTDKKLVNYVFLAEDITLRKNSEDALKNAYDQMENRVKERTAELLITNEALQKEIIEHKIDEEKIIASLKEKEVLLKEIHHRVKNNMQIISSMLGLQSSYVKDTQYNSLLKDSQNRIKSMALIHEKLYQSDNMANVNFFEYLKTLSINLYQSYGIDMERIKLEIDVEKLNLNIDTAIPLGLITNEIVSNSFKHGYPNGRSGKIYINIKNIQNNEYEMIIKDDGIGIPDGVNLNNVKTLGLSLIHALVEQIDGKIEIFSKNGLEYKIRFIS